MVMRIGIIGLSEGNGHPFSFSSIINGYSDTGYEKADWPFIHNYLRARDPSEIGMEGVQVTHAWTQDPALTATLCEASLIPNAVKDYHDFLGQVDAVIVARDDYETHFEMTMPFLQAGLPVFVDKPLSISSDELRIYRPYLERGQLISCAGMRYAKELDEARADLKSYGKVSLVRAAIVNGWEKYGIHMIDAILGLFPARPVSIEAMDSDHMSVSIRMDDGMQFQIDALGKVAKTLRVDIFGEKKCSSHDLFDNFLAFRRTLEAFVHSVREKKLAIPPEDTWTGMQLLIAGKIAKAEKRKVMLSEIRI